MSKINGDKARHNRQQKRKAELRLKLRDLRSASSAESKKK